MTNQDRFIYYNSGELQPMVQIELLDWMAYWTTAGVDGIQDALLRAQTAEAIRSIMSDLNGMTNKVSMLAMGEAVIKDALHPTEANIKTAVTSIMTNKLRWLTGISDSE